MANPPIIRFSHAYRKLDDGNGKPVREAKLLMVLPLSNDQLRVATDFLKYDTEDGKYEIGYHSWYVLLIFRKPFGDLFTTVRPMFGRFGNKAEFYSKNIGREFMIEVPDVSLIAR